MCVVISFGTQFSQLVCHTCEALRNRPRIVTALKTCLVGFSEGVCDGLVSFVRLRFECHPPPKRNDAPPLVWPGFVVPENTRDVCNKITRVEHDAISQCQSMGGFNPPAGIQQEHRISIHAGLGVGGKACRFFLFCVFGVQPPTLVFSFMAAFVFCKEHESGRGSGVSEVGDEFWCCYCGGVKALAAGFDRMPRAICPMPPAQALFVDIHTWWFTAPLQSFIRGMFARVTA